MAKQRKRKTQAERNQEWWDAAKRVWVEFRPKLAALNSYVDAQLLVRQAPPPDSPGRTFYSNLAFFLAEFHPPFGASRDELELYLELIIRLDDSGQLKPGARQGVEQGLRSAIPNRIPL